MRKAIAIAAILTLAGCGEAPSGFISLQSTMFLAPGDSLTCGRLEIHAKPNALLGGFFAAAPGSCELTLHAKDSFFGTTICELTVKENAITSVYLTRRGGGLACQVS